MSENYRSREERKQAERQKREQLKKEKTSKKQKSSFFKKFLIACLLIGIVTFGAGCATFFAMIKDAPKIDESLLRVPLSTKFYDKDNNFIYEYGKEKRTKITYDQIPKVVENAFLATEDSRFYKHHGIDIQRTAKAIFANITGGFGSQGGSTITQQVVKNSFLSPEKTIKRKVQEWYLAYKLEEKYSKHEILEMYLNKIYFGNYAYGVATAAQNYYGKKLDELTLPEAALLAGLPQAPSAYDPTEEDNRAAAEKRRNIVLSLMHKHGYISKQEMEEAKKVPVAQGILPRKQDNHMPYPAFLDAVVKEVESTIKDVDISSDGLKIYTTLDPKAQAYAEEILNTDKHISYPNERFQAAFTMLDTKTGEVRAIGSGRNEGAAKFAGKNYAVDIRRQPGSTFKPIMDYGPAIEHLKWSTYHQIADEPYTYSDGTPIKNADNKHLGNISMREALRLSRNIPALKTLQEVGLDKGKDFAVSLGIPLKTAYESYAIGGFNGVSPLQLAGAYSAFGNDGEFIQPHTVTKIVYPDGKEIDFKPKPKRVMKDYTAYMITDMLRTVVKSGTGTAANIPSLDLAGKTGTTNFDKNVRAKYGLPQGATNDSWFAGYTPQYTIAVWTGYEKTTSENYIWKSQTKIAQYIFKAMMSHFATDRSSFQQPNSVYRIDNELYIKGEKVDDVPNQKADVPSGVKANYDQASSTISLSWSYPADKKQDTVFEINYSVDGGSTTKLTTTKQTAVTISGVKPGSKYSFSIIAVNKKKKSDPATVTVVVPGEEPKEPVTPPVNPVNPEGNNGNGQGNGNGNGNGNQDSNNDTGTENDTGGTVPGLPGSGSGRPGGTDGPTTPPSNQ